MFKLLQKRALALLLIPFLFLSACAPKHQSEPDCGFVQNVYGERISWKDTAPISLLVHESFPAEMLPALQKAVADWEQAMGRPVFRIVQTGYQSAGPRQDGVNVIYWMKTWEENKSTEQARTSVYWVGDQIREADIRVNAKNFCPFLEQPAVHTDQDCQDVHLESLLLHELGHVLGLKHKDNQSSIMATYLGSQTKRTIVSKADQDNLKCEY